MKVLHVIAKFTESYAGMAIACKELVESQKRIGITPTVVTSNLDHPTGKIEKPLIKPTFQNGVRIIYCPVLIESFVFSFQFIKILKKEIKNSDIVHIHGFYRFPQSFAAFYARILNKPYLISPHGSLNPKVFNKKEKIFLRRLYQQIFEKRNIKYSSIIHFTAFREKLNAQYFVPLNKGVVIPNGINVESYKNLPKRDFFKNKYGIDPRIFKILFLGRIAQVKGLDILLKSIAILVKSTPNVILLIIGPDYENYKEKLILMIKQLDIENKVKFLGKLNRDMVNHAYVDSDLFILPSYSENFGLTIIESLACGCPVIISKKVNIANSIKNNNLGYVVDLNQNEITKSIVNYYNKPEKEKNILKKKIRDYTLKNYDWYNSAVSFKNIYKKLNN